MLLIPSKGAATSAFGSRSSIGPAGPGWQVERNLVRSIAYASAEPLERFGIDTLIVTLTRSSPDAGGQRSSYEVVRSDLDRGNDGYSAPVRPISLVKEPCGAVRK